MATTKGCQGAFTVGSSPAALGEITTWTADESADQLDATSMDGTCTKKYQSGTVESSVSWSGWYDAADAGQAELTIGAVTDFALYPGGNSTGKPEITGNGTVLSVQNAGEVNGIVTGAWTISVNGGLTRGTVT